MRLIRLIYRATFATLLLAFSILLVTDTPRSNDPECSSTCETVAESPWYRSDRALYLGGAVVGLASVAQYRATYGERERRNRERAMRVEVHLKAALIRLYSNGAVAGPFYDVGLQIWKVPTWYRRLFPRSMRNWLRKKLKTLRKYAWHPKLERVARLRIWTGAPSGIVWRKGKGVVGICLADTGPHRGLYADLRSLYDRFGGTDEKDWMKVEHDDRLGLDYDEFKTLRGKYGQIFAIRIDNRHGEPIACITLNVPPDFTTSIHTVAVQQVLSTAIEEARAELG